MKKRILYIITQGNWGGAQRYIYDLIQEGNQAYEIILAIGEKKGNQDLQKKIKDSFPQVQQISLHHLNRKISPIQDIRALFELKQLYHQIQPDIIHLNSTKIGILGSLASRGSKKRNICYTVHGWIFNESLPFWKKTTYQFLESITARYKQHIIVLSKEEYTDALKKVSIPKEKIQIIPIGIDLPKHIFSQKEARQKIIQQVPPSIFSPDHIMIGTIANHYKTKGLDILIASAQKVKESHKNILFLIIGDGPERKKLEQQIKEASLQDTVFLIGFIKDAAQYIPAFNILVLPSRKEGLPYTILEAMARKVPIISTNVGGISSLITNNKQGILIPPSQRNILAEKIISLSTDVKKQTYLAQHAYHTVQAYTKEMMWQKTNTVYKKILS